MGWLGADHICYDTPAAAAYTRCVITSNCHGLNAEIDGVDAVGPVKAFSYFTSTATHGGYLVVPPCIDQTWQGLSAADGALIAVPILAVWAVAWGFRALIHTVRGTDEETVKDEA